jgi:WS/DGAT/MGAT family acyltransferase
MQQLSGLDASFLYFETPSAPMHIAGLAIYDPSASARGQITYQDILKNTEQRLHRMRCFRRRLAPVPMNLDHPYWIEDASFDLEFHVRHNALPRPGDWRQLVTLAGRLHGRPLDLARPLWELHFIEGLDGIEGLPKGSFAIVTKTHHAAIDGVSGVELTAAMHDLDPDAKPPAATEPWRPEPVPTPVELLARAWVNNLQRPLRFAQVLSQTIPATQRLTAQLMSRRHETPHPVPRTRFNAAVTPHRVVEGRAFPLDVIRAIRKRVEGATVNDVVLAICGGALRRYLASKGDLPEEPLLAMAPISTRRPGEQRSEGNQVSQMTVSLATDVADPLERLRAVRRSTEASKEITNAIGARLLTDYTQFVPAATAALAARLASQMGIANRASPLFNTVVTNVPGPQVPLYAYGARLVANYGMGPLADGMGLCHPVFSYCGEITISVTSCREMLPDAPFYAECLERSYAELRDAALARP